MAEEPRKPEPDPKAAIERPDMKEPPPLKPPVTEPPDATKEEIVEEDRFQSTDN